MVQGTLNGLGERCGNANLITLIPTLMLKDGAATSVSTGRQSCRNCGRLSLMLEEMLNRAPDTVRAVYRGARFRA